MTNSISTSNRYGFINFRILISLAILSLFSICFSASLIAQGNLMILPKRVVFEASKGTQDLNLVNTGSDTARYVISLVQMKMREDGTFEKITVAEEGQKFADKYVRVFPRSVTLAPNESQVVKVQVARSTEMTEGEYRSHIYFRAVPNDKPLEEKKPVKDSTAFSINLTPVFGISIPVIIRVGQSTSNVTLSDIAFQKVKDSLPSLKLSFNRSGNMSVYGDVSVEFTAADGKVVQVANNKGIAVYTPNLKRNCVLLLDNSQNIDYTKGKFHITYAEQVNGRKKKLTEAEMQVQ